MKNYLKSLIKKADQNVRFRRIVRGLPELEEWIDKMIDENEGNHNFSLRCILDSEDKPHLEGHVPVQLIDEDITYFVAVGEQRETDGARDMYIKSEDVNSQWMGYYDRLWEDCLTLMDRGRIQEENLAEYQEHIQEIRDRRNE